MVVHEFGHSFAGLADEYSYDDQYVEMYYPDTEPWEPNITTLADFASKWQDMLPAGTVLPNGEVVADVPDGRGARSVLSRLLGRRDARAAAGAMRAFSTERKNEALLAIAYAGAKAPKGIVLPGLGKLIKAKSKARLGRNPATGETIKIPARTKAKFRLCKAAKDAVLA